MEGHDKEFEKYLGEFRPVRPRALPGRAVVKTVWTRRLAAAAVLAVGLGAAFWPMWRRQASRNELVATMANVTPDMKPAPQPLSLLPLTQMALNDPEQLEAELVEASRRELPDFRGNNSALSVLAKE